MFLAVQANQRFQISLEIVRSICYIILVKEIGNEHTARYPVTSNSIYHLSKQAATRQVNQSSVIMAPVFASKTFLLLQLVITGTFTRVVFSFTSKPLLASRTTLASRQNLYILRTSIDNKIAKPDDAGGDDVTTTSVFTTSSPPLPYPAPINGEAIASASTGPMPFPLVIWKFTRPHTLIGSALAIPAITLLAAPSYAAALSPAAMYSVLYAMLPSLLMNLYITGLNQVTDMEIDAVNKPFLPIPAGLLSRKNAAIVCVVSLVASLLLGIAHPVYGTQGLNVVLWGSAILGTLYSLKPFRLKRFPFLAAFCIVAVRGTIINASFFAHAQSAAYGGGVATTVMSVLKNDLRCSLSSAFFAVFGVVIALMKDVPDVLGDRMASIRTFSVRVGPQRIFHFSRHLLSVLMFSTAAGFVKLALSASSQGLFATRLVVALSSVAAGLSLGFKASGVDPESPKDVYSYYMHLWKIFYASYLLLPLAR